ncbi:MAG: hypothetical protein ABSD20_04200, partial [Terriglobales bacterium]
ERPIDILFIGTSSPRRQDFFARNADYFAGKKVFVYMPEGDKPFLKQDSRTIDFATFVALVKRSKLVLNVHRDDIPYLEWQRIVTLGIMQQTLVITDTCLPAPGLEPNLDYLEGPMEALPSLCESALSSVGIAEGIATRAYEKLKANYSFKEITGRCWTFIFTKGLRRDGEAQTL